MTEKLKGKYSYIVIILIFVIGFATVSLSSENKPTGTSDIKQQFDENEYEEHLERRLKSLIEQIDGVGTVSVMITLEGSAIYSYAENSSENIASDGGVKKEVDIVLSAKSSSVKEPIVSGYSLPKIKGAAVVCKNKLNAVLLEKVIGTVSASLGITTDKIYVTN